MALYHSHRIVIFTILKISKVQKLSSTYRWWFFILFSCSFFNAFFQVKLCCFQKFDCLSVRLSFFLIGTNFSWWSKNIPMMDTQTFHKNLRLFLILFLIHGFIFLIQGLIAIPHILTGFNTTWTLRIHPMGLYHVKLGVGFKGRMGSVKYRTER